MRTGVPVVRRLVLFLSTLGLLAAPALAAAVPSSADPGAYSVSAPVSFSPDGNGVQDKAAVRYTLPERTRVRLQVSRPHGTRAIRSVDLGLMEAGTHTWSWNGRNAKGRVVVDGDYRVLLVLPRDGYRQAPVEVDTSFSADLTAPTYAVSRQARPQVFPRTTVVTDALRIEAHAYEAEVRSARLVIRSSSGRVVHSVDVDKPVLHADGWEMFGRGDDVHWTARKRGEPLPRGRYHATVVGTDGVGNSGRSDRLRIWVSGDELVWREQTTTVLPAESRLGPCDYSTANGCGDGTVRDCGEVVPSTQFAGGLSHRSKPCADPASTGSRAQSSHILEVPEATGIRGLAAMRVAFTGAPTTAGESDTGTLRVGDSTVQGTSGRSGWVAVDPYWAEGNPAFYPVPRRHPAAVWGFATTGTDSVDVASYTVDVRYLAVAD